MVKTKLDLSPQASRIALHALRGSLKGMRLDVRDGLRLEWDDRWVQLRASNTEPILRVIAEARTAAQAQALADEYIARLHTFVADKPKQGTAARVSVRLGRPVVRSETGAAVPR